MSEKISLDSSGDCYKKHESVISRKPTKLTEFLDELRKFIIEERENKGYR